MSILTNLHRSIGVVGATALLVTAGGLAAMAAPDSTSAIPASNGKIRFCYNKADAAGKDGGAAVRTYDTAVNTKKCASGDKRIDVPVVTNLASGQGALAFGTVNVPNGAFADVTGYAITLPAAGTYLVTAEVRGRIQQTAANVHCYIVTQLVAGVTAVPNTLHGITMMDAAAGASGDGVTTQAPMTGLITVAGPTIVKVQAKTDGTSCANSNENIFSDVTGTSTINFVKIAG